MRGYPQFSFWISIGLVKIYISCIITHRGKKYLSLVGTVLKRALNNWSQVYKNFVQQKFQEMTMETFRAFQISLRLVQVHQIVFKFAPGSPVNSVRDNLY